MFRVRPFENKTVSWWYQHRDEIDMEPQYQRRGRLWKPFQKTLLIDSILNDYDIPKLYLADFTYLSTDLNVNRLPYAIIDGKQRLETIFEFFDDALPLDNNFVYDDQPELPLGGLTLRDIRTNYPKTASKFETFNLSVMSVITDDAAKINELFVRLNSSKPLTGAEVRNAMPGSVPEITRTIREHDFFVRCIGFSVNRGQDLNTAAKLLLLEFRGELVDTQKANLDRFVHEARESSAYGFEAATERVNATLSQMTNVFVPRDPLLASQGPVTLYYWLVRTYGARPELREFLVRFIDNLSLNKRLVSENPEQADPELLSYDFMNRSTNHQWSLKGRFRILTERLERFSGAPENARQRAT